MNRVPAGLAGVKAGCVYLCQITLCDPIWQVTLHNSEMEFHEELNWLTLTIVPADKDDCVSYMAFSPCRPSVEQKQP